MRAKLLYLVFFVSGGACLGYSIVWARMFSTGLGHETVSMLAIVAAFFCGFAIGAWGLDCCVSASRVPGRWYGGLEAVVGGWALVTTILIPQANDWVLSFIGPTASAARHWSIAFSVPVFVLLPATVAMGATLPAMDRLFSRLRQEGRSIGGLYAANTLGAVAGVMATTLWLVPNFGFRTTVLWLAASNLLVALVVLADPARCEAERPTVFRSIGEIGGPLRLGATVFATGTFSMAYQVLGVRVMCQVLENTVYTFAVGLCACLLSTAAGAATYQRCIVGDAKRILERLLLATSVACLFGVQVLGRVDVVYLASHGWLGRGIVGSVTAELVVALAVFLLPSFFMGATFSHLAQLARNSSGGVGWALGIDALGGAVAPLIFVVLLLPAIGSRASIMVLSLGYLLLLPRLAIKPIAVAAVPIVLLSLTPANLILVNPGPGGHIVASREGVMATASVVADPWGGLRLRVGDRFYLGGTRAWFAARREAHIALSLHPQPKSALFLGVGTGITMGSTMDHPGLAADGVELFPEVLELLPHFDDSNGKLGDNHRIRLLAADARRFVRSANQQYDVIVGDLFHPGRDGAGSLYTAEHFYAIRERLAPGGIFCQWLPLFQMDAEMLRVILRTWLRVFPHGIALLNSFDAQTPSLGLIAATESLAFAPDWMETRYVKTLLDGPLAEVGLANTISLLGNFVAGPSQLAAFAGRGPSNTDDHPLVTFSAPWHAYESRFAPHVSAYATLEALLSSSTPRASDILIPSEYSGAFEQRLERYFAAVRLFLRADIERVLGRRKTALQGYVESVEASPDFWFGYRAALAFVRARVDPIRVPEYLARLRANVPTGVTRLKNRRNRRR